MDLEPQALPHTFEPKVQNLNPVCADSYATVVQHEQRLMADGRTNSHLAPIRVLGYILREDLAVAGIEHLARAINDTIRLNKDLRDLGLYYTKYFIKIFYRSQGPTPVPSHHPSRPSFDITRGLLLTFIMEPENLDHRRGRELALERDGRRDIIRRGYDVKDSSEEAVSYHAAVGGGGEQSLHSAHIIPQHLGISAAELAEAQANEVESWTDPVNVQKRLNMWTMLQYFGKSNIAVELVGGRIHDPSNLLTLTLGDHDMFDSLSLWLEPLEDDERRARVCVSRPRARPKGPTGRPIFHVAFEEKVLDDHNIIHAPCPAYLRLHAACCRIAWMSGAALIFRDLYESPDDIMPMICSSSMLDAVSSRLEYDTSEPKVLELMTQIPVSG